ncbi:MAG TPA: hypothetical protein VFR19_02850, partial [Hyphomicrobiaceae bacterium]|nr:hypothetical protein [Hyphomicrobiaceae bacterium]
MLARRLARKRAGSGLAAGAQRALNPKRKPIPTANASGVRQVAAEPGGGFGHHLTEGGLDVNLVV